jgi:hypothetical protein
LPVQAVLPEGQRTHLQMVQTTIPAISDKRHRPLNIFTGQLKSLPDNKPDILVNNTVNIDNYPFLHVHLPGAPQLQREPQLAAKFTEL